MLSFDSETNKLYHAPLMTASINNGADKGLSINNIEFARKALEIHDIIAVSQFSRLREILASDEGVLDCRLVGGVSSEGKSRLQLYVQGTLQLSCQRCLEPFEFELDITSNFTIVANEQAIQPESDDRDDEDYLVAETQMQVIELIEDEVLLALPLAPKHVQNQCAASSKLNELKKPSPFAVLQGLKTGKSQN
ncbi:MAG: YceD family protein [Methylophilaceae bacterium]